MGVVWGRDERLDIFISSRCHSWGTARTRRHSRWFIAQIFETFLCQPTFICWENEILASIEGRNVGKAEGPVFGRRKGENVFCFMLAYFGREKCRTDVYSLVYYEKLSLRSFYRAKINMLRTMRIISDRDRF